MTRPERGVNKRLDWAAAHRRLNAVEPSPQSLREAADRVLAERAVRLAAVGEPEEAADSWLEVLRFRRGEWRFAIESRFVVEVGKCRRLSRVPGAQAGLLGITNLRGDLLPVFDLTSLRSSSVSEQPLTFQLLVLGEGTPDFGVLCDSVEEVARLSLSSLSETRVMGAAPHPEYARGICEDGCVLLDAAVILRDRLVFVAKPGSGSPERENT